MEIYEKIIRPLFVEPFEPELVHDWTWRVAHQAAKFPGVIESISGEPIDDKRLYVTIGKNLPLEAQIHTKNPAWLGAGPSKTGIGLNFAELMGAGGAIIGAVVKEPQPGNEGPRLWRREGGKYVNAYGFNSPGMVVVKRNLEQYDGRLNMPVVINVGKNKDTSLEDAPQEYGEVVEYMYSVADGFEICPSSPNTEGLRKLLQLDSLRRLANAVVEPQLKQGLLLPTAIKASPDMSEEEGYGLIQVAKEYNLIISATNTTVRRDIFTKYFADCPGIIDSQTREFRGGASGDIPEFRDLADERLKFFYREGGPDLEYWAGGGVNLAEHAWRKVGFGANIIYIVAGLPHRGPGIFNQINSGLVDKLDQQITKSYPLSYYRGSLASAT
jgi:dihydroorotate dehydrogenase